MQNILIVGCGPAGISAAYFLSDKGFDVTVIERLTDNFQRYHNVCGGGVSRSAFRKTGLPAIGVINEIEHTRIIWPDGTEVRMRTKGYIIDRPKFISEMKEICSEKGVKFKSGTVVNITDNGNSYSVRTADGESQNYDIIIGADGCFSVVRGDIFHSSPLMKVPATEFITDKVAEKDLKIHLISDGSGTYTWEFPRGNGSGTGGMKGKYSEDEYLSKGSRFIPFGGVGKIAERNAYLIGDAAAMANPVSYGGLKAAFLSAKKASEAISSKNPDSYQKWWDSSILSDRRFMEFNVRLKMWSEEDLNKAVRPFRHGGIYLPGIWACITQPKNVNMYFGCLFAFKYGW